MSISELHQAYLAHPTISTDTRKDPKGTIFFCLKGLNFDANTFANQALKQGAALVVSDDKRYVGVDGIVVVDNVLTCLQELATYHRGQFKFPVIGLTGSNGKTTNKELMMAVLSKKYRTYATKGNLNNHIGVPLTLLSVPLDAEIAIIEMGANHQGEIRDLCKICKPNYALITNIGKAHLEGFGGEEGVIKGKKELYDFIESTDGEVFVHANDDLLMDLSADLSRTLYGSSPDSFVSGTLMKKGSFVVFQFNSQHASSGIIQTNLVGDYNYTNLLAAACLGLYFDVDVDDISAALSEYQPDNNRSQLKDTGKNKVILDAYNANPSSVHAAIDNFAQTGSSSKLILLGQMMELGEYSKEEHQKVIDKLKSLSLDAMLVGPQFSECNLASYQQFNTIQDLISAIQEKPIRNHNILIKGSRSIAMEKVLEVL